MLRNIKKKLKKMLKQKDEEMSKITITNLNNIINTYRKNLKNLEEIILTMKSKIKSLEEELKKKRR